MEKQSKGAVDLHRLRREWDEKVNRLAEAVDAVFKGKIDGKESDLISPDLKVRHKKTQYLYTVVSVGKDDVILRTPEGEEFLVDKGEMQDTYEID